MPEPGMHRQAARLGLVLVVCGPSGVGKGTLVARLRRQYPGFAFSVSCTTRSPRQGEQDGVDYHFVTRERFEALRAEGHFAEWAEVHGNYYGTPKTPVAEHLAAGRDVIFDIDVQGAFQLRGHFPDGLYVFILPPSLSVLEARLRGRGTDSEEQISRRMRNALGELRQAHRFDYLVVNDSLDAAYEALRAVYQAGTLAAFRCPGLPDQLLAGERIGMGGGVR